MLILCSGKGLSGDWSESVADKGPAMYMQVYKGIYFARVLNQDTV